MSWSPSWAHESDWGYSYRFGNRENVSLSALGICADVQEEFVE